MRTRSRGNHVRGEVIHFFLHSLGAGSVLLANATTKIKNGIKILSMLGQYAIRQTRFESYRYSCIASLKSINPVLYTLASLYERSYGEAIFFVTEI